MRYTWSFVLKRVGLLLLIVWSAATLNFFIPKITPRNPLREKLMMEASRSGYIPPGFDEMVKAYEVKFGLDQPLWLQYFRYLGDMARLDLGYSISNFPKTVGQLIGEALPWTLGLLTVTTALAFILGTLLGALIAWPRSPRWLAYLAAPILTLSTVPFYLLGLILIYFVAFQWKLLPLGGGYSIGTIPSFSVSFFLDILKHAILPALAIILANAGGWAIGMRGMMVTVQGEDYMTFGEAKGLKGWRLFYKYAVRNALLPQVTGLALSFSFIVSGAVLVELVFGYPGIGSLLARAIQQLDYFTIYGVVFILIVAIGVAMFVMDMIYPLLDPRITYE
ncbi:MAG: ABC transporter permease [Caldilineaceae bacterium]|nr:ABC transporter permease [Caldilineaceae bacterium]